MADLSFKLESFEGPLDVLLHLISKNKLDIKEIKISEICDQYIDYLEKMKELDLEIAGEFLEMASRLLYIKSKMLLPKSKDEQEDEDVVDLVRMLEEYKKYKELSVDLKTQYDIYSKALPKEPDELSLPIKYELKSSKDELVLAFRKLLSRVPKGNFVKFDAFRGIVGREPFPVGDKIAEILERFRNKAKFTFLTLFKSVQNRSEIVAVFLAVLELVKTDKVKLEDRAGEVILTKRKA